MNTFNFNKNKKNTELIKKIKKLFVQLNIKIKEIVT